jgi:hypothetical protein
MGEVIGDPFLDLQTRHLATLGPLACGLELDIWAQPVACRCALVVGG